MMAESVSSQSTPSEGKDVQLFRIRMVGIFKQIVETTSIEKFGEIYGDILQKKQAKRLLKIWRDQALKDMMKDLNELITEQNLDEKLTKRAQIIEECEVDRNVIAWRPPGNPKEHMRSLDMQEKLKAKEELEELVKEKEAIVEDLKSKVQTGRTEVLNAEKELDNDMKLLQARFIQERNCRAVLQQHLDNLLVKNGKQLYELQKK